MADTTPAQAPDSEAWLTTGEVARLFHVAPPTVRAWDRIHRLTIERTLGGHRRYLQSEVLALKAAQQVQAVA